MDECRIANFGDTLWDGDGGEVGTILEGTFPNLGEAHGNVNRRQAGIGKGIVTDSLQGRWKRDGGDAFSVVERIGGDISDALGDDQVGYLRVLVAVEVLGIVERGGIRTAPTYVAPPGDVIGDEFAISQVGAAVEHKASCRLQRFRQFNCGQPRTALESLEAEVGDTLGYNDARQGRGEQQGITAEFCHRAFIDHDALASAFVKCVRL